MSRIDEALKRRSGGGTAPQKACEPGPVQADVHSILEHYPREAGAPDEFRRPSRTSSVRAIRCRSRRVVTPRSRRDSRRAAADESRTSSW